MNEFKKCEIGNRSLFLVDAENLWKGTTVQPAHAAFVATRFNELGHYTQGDQTIIGSSHIGAIGSIYWPNDAKRVWKSGVDGGELAIIDEVRSYTNLDTFKQVVIGSGDHAFTPLVHELREKGLFVHVIGNRGSISRNLQIAANFVSYLPVYTYDYALAA